MNLLFFESARLIDRKETRRDRISWRRKRHKAHVAAHSKVYERLTFCFSQIQLPFPRHLLLKDFACIDYRKIIVIVTRIRDKRLFTSIINFLICRGKERLWGERIYVKQFSIIHQTRLKYTVRSYEKYLYPVRVKQYKWYNERWKVKFDWVGTLITVQHK